VRDRFWVRGVASWKESAAGSSVDQGMAVLPAVRGYSLTN